MKNISNLCKKLSSDKAYLIQNPLNLRYLTGTDIDTGVLVIIDQRAYFITDFRYIETAQAYFKGSEVEVILQKKLSEDISALLREHGVSTLEVEAEYQTLKSVELYKKCCERVCADELDDALTALRMIKQPYEVENIKAAQKLTDDAFEHILNYVKPGVCERDVALEIEMYMRKNGAEGVSFDLIAVSGKKSSLPHGIPSNKPIENGDFLTLDIGCKVNGYCSDMTRTVAVGFASDEMRAVYDTVLKAQTAAIDAVKPGVICSEVDRAARDIIYSAGYEGCFGHATGHSVGLYIHEEPRFSPNCDTVLKSGMVMTIEPGIYLPDKFGVRIEDMVIVTDDGKVDITNSRKDLIVLQ